MADEDQTKSTNQTKAAEEPKEEKPMPPMGGGMGGGMGGMY